MTGTERHIQILRVIAAQPDGLRMKEIQVGLEESSVHRYVRELVAKRLVDAIPLRRVYAARTSHVPHCSYRVNEEGLARLANVDVPPCPFAGERAALAQVDGCWAQQSSKRRRAA